MTLRDLSVGERFRIPNIRWRFEVKHKLDTTAICGVPERPDYYATIRLDVDVERVE